MKRPFRTNCSWHPGLFAALLLVGSASFAGDLRAEAIKIEALGASIVCGEGVGAANAWPAQLEAMLRAKGYDVSMTVDCVSGASGEAILGRAGSIGAGTRVVLYNTGGTNNRSGENVMAIAAQTESAIRAHGAVPIRVEYGLPANLLQRDGIHPNLEGHRVVAEGLVSKVIGVIGQVKN